MRIASVVTPFELAVTRYDAIRTSLRVGIPLKPVGDAFLGANAALRAGIEILARNGAAPGLVGQLRQGLKVGEDARYWAFIIETVSPGAVTDEREVHGMAAAASTAAETARLGSRYILPTESMRSTA